MKIHDVEKYPEILIRPCNFMFPPDYSGEWGLVATDGKARHVYVFPLLENFNPDEPIKFLRAALNAYHEDFVDLIYEASNCRQNLRVGDELILWNEYRHFFESKPLPPSARIIDKVARP